MKIFLFLLLFFVSCSKRAVCDLEVMGLCEFAQDSLLAQEGKYGVWEIEGKCNEIDEGTLCEYVDLISEDDRLNIVIYHPTRVDLTVSMHDLCQKIGGFRVTEGCIQLPGYEKIKVSGLTLNQAKEKLVEELRNDIKDIDVFVVFAERPSHKVEVSGMAVLAEIPVDGKVRLYEVLAKAKIPSTANLHCSYVLRDGKFLKIDMVRLIKGGDMSQNIVMMPNDKVYIASPQDSSILVMGEVNRVGLVPLLNGSLSLREALVLSGGIPYSGDRQNINVIRTQGDHPKIFVMSWYDLIHFPANQQLLVPGDVVYVSATAITEWSRFMDQLKSTLTNMANAEVVARFMR